MTTTRETVLTLLSKEEQARVTASETLLRLLKGDEYLDLAHPELGVQRSIGDAPATAVLPRKAIHLATWKKILAKLPAKRA